MAGAAKSPSLQAIESNICQLIEESQTGEAEEVTPAYDATHHLSTGKPSHGGTTYCARATSPHHPTTPPPPHYPQVTLKTVQRIYGTRFGKPLNPFADWPSDCTMPTAAESHLRNIIESMPMLQLQDFDFGNGVVTYILSLRNSDQVAQDGAVGTAEAAWPTPQASSSSWAPRGASGGGASGGAQQAQLKGLDLALATTSLHLSGFPDTTTKENLYALLSKHCHTNTRTGGGDLAESVYIMTSNKTNTPYCFANFKR